MPKAMVAPTPISVRFGKEEKSMFRILQARAKASRRTLSEQLKYYTYVGMVTADNPLIGEMKTGALKGVRVLKFKLGPLQLLLAYEFNERRNVVELLDVGASAIPARVTESGVGS
jgi:hypothetical protein